MQDSQTRRAERSPVPSTAPSADDPLLRRIDDEHAAALAAATAVVAHDISNFVNTMCLSSQIIRRRCEQAGTEPDVMTHTIMEAADELRDYVTRYRQSQPSENMTSCLADTARYASSRLHAVAARTGVQIQLDLPDEACRVLGPRNGVDQVAVQLCRNAVESMPDGGTVTLRVASSGDQYLLIVSDGGIGVPPDAEQFRPFVTTKIGHAGLGLAIVRNIVGMLRGTIRATSNQPKGSVYTVGLPIASA